MASPIVIPGDAGALEALADRIATVAGEVDSVRSRVAANGLEGSWSGDAGDAFRSALWELPGELELLPEGFHAAGSAVRAFATTLAELQERARRYNYELQLAEERARQAQLREDEARTRLDAARLACSVAVDAMSMTTARNALHLAEDVFSAAAADVADASNARTELLTRCGGPLIASYEAAVRRCCATLDATRSPGGRSLPGLIDRVIGGIVAGDRALSALWATGVMRLAEAGGEGQGVLAAFERLLEQSVPLDGVARFGFLIKLTSSKGFRFLGRAAIPLSVIGFIEAYKEAWADGRGESPFGRAVGAGVASSSALSGLVSLGAGRTGLAGRAGTIGLAYSIDDFLMGGEFSLLEGKPGRGGVLSEDLRGLGLVTGSALTGAQRGAERAYSQDVRDRNDGNVLGLALHVAGGESSGFASGALHGDDLFVQRIAEGKDGHWMQAVNGAFDDGVEDIYGAASSAIGGGERLLKSIF